MIADKTYLDPMQPGGNRFKPIVSSDGGTGICVQRQIGFLWLLLNVGIVTGGGRRRLMNHSMEIIFFADITTVVSIIPDEASMSNISSRLGSVLMTRERKGNRKAVFPLLLRRVIVYIAQGLKILFHKAWKPCTQSRYRHQDMEGITIRRYNQLGQVQDIIRIEILAFENRRMIIRK